MKKITVLILMFFLSISGYSQILEEGFEGSTVPNLPLDTWVLGSGTWGVFDNGTGLNQSWKENTGAATTYEGARSALKEREQNGTTTIPSKDYLATPLITVPAAGTYQLRFWTRTGINGDTGTLFRIMVAPGTAAQNAEAAYTPLQSWTETSLTTVFNVYQEKVVDLSAFAGQQIYLAFLSEFLQPTAAFGGDRWFVDKVRIVERCQEPGPLAAGAISQTSATLTWPNPGGASQWEIAILPFSVTPVTPTSGIIVNTNTYVATGTTDPVAPFTPTTQYQYWVRSVCPTTSDPVTSEWVGPFNFTTSSPGLSCASPIVVPPGVPYSTTDNTGNYGDTTDVAQPTSCVPGAINYMTGNDVFYSYTPTVSGAISITLNPTGIRTGIFVYEGCANVGVNCVAGVANTAGTIREIPSLAVTAGTTYIIVISSANTPQTVGYTLTIQTLNCAAPTGLSATGTGPSSANLSWGNPGAATSWEVFVQTPGSGIPTTAGTTANTNTNFPVTTLQNGTALTLGQYQYWVRADCGNGTFSPWAGPYVFNTTSCASGCNYTFVVVDTWGDGWNGNTMTITQGTQTIATLTGPTAAQGQTPVNVSVPMCDGPFQLFWNAGGTFPGEVGVSIINSFGQTLYVRTPGTSGQNSVLYSGVVDCTTPACLPPTNLTVAAPTTTGATLNWTPNGPLPVSWQIYAAAPGSPAPTETTTPLVTIPGTTPLAYVLTGLLTPDTAYTYWVRAVCAAGGNNPWSAASPTFTTLPTCPKPTNLVISSPSETTLTVSWTAGGTETAWQYIILPAGAPAPTPATTGWISTTTNVNNVITGLTSGTSYSVYVIAVCSGTDSSTVGAPVTGNTTVCAPASQCLYTFTMVDTFGDNWNGGSMTVVQNGIVLATLTGPTTAQGQTPVSVQVPICNSVPFSLFWSVAGNFPNEIGITITSFLGEVIFTKAPGTGTASATTPLYTGTGECIPPTCLKPTNVAVTSTGLNSAIITWTDNNTPAATSWDILVLPATAPPPAQNATGWINVNTTTYNYTGLASATNYIVYVRAVCSSTDNSFWSNGAQFNTTVCAASNLCEYTFIMVDNFGDGWNGNTMTITQNGIVMGTLTGPLDADNQTPISVIIPLCNNTPFQLYWNAGGQFPGEVGVSIVNTTGTVIYTKNPGTGTQNSVLFNGTVTCIPVTCPKPSQVLASNITTTSATITWVESGSATAWEILILPFGAATPTTAGIATGMPYNVNGLAPGTSYTVFVRAICSATDISNWSIRYNFATTPLNDECATAYFAPVNQDLSCVQTVSGTINGATGSTPASACGASANDDVWFYFNATAVAHIVSFNNTTGATNLNFAVYSGDCGSLTQVACADENSETITGLTVGTTYRIRVYSVATTPQFNNAFNLCISTVPCATATPFCTGQVLTYPNATGINPGLGSFGCLGSSPNPAFFFLQVNQAGPLNYLMTQSTTPGGPPTLDVDYALWGPFPDNLAACAVIPNDNPVSCSFSAAPTENFSIANAQLCQIYVVMITNYSDNPGFITFTQTNTTGGGTTACYPYNTFNYSANSFCQNAANPAPILIAGAVAGTYSATPAGIIIDPATGVINLAASTPGNYVVTSTTIPTVGGVCPAIPNITTIRSVTITATPAATISYGATTQFCNSISAGQTVTVTGTPGGTFSSTNGLFISAVNGTIVPSISTPGNYTVTYTIPASGGCPAFTTTAPVQIILAPAIPYINNVTACDSYTLPTLTVGNYFTQSGGTGTQLAAGAAITSSQTIYAYAADAVCSDEQAFTVTINATPVIPPIAPVVACTTFTLPVLTVGNYYTAAGGTGTQLNAGDVITTDQTIYVYAASGTCATETNFTVTFIGVITTPGDQVVCGSYTLPALAFGNYYTQTGSVGPLAAGTVISATQTIFVASGSCEDSFLVTVNNAPTLAAASPVASCGCYTLPVLTVGNYYTATNGGGTPLAAGDQICTDQTIFVYGQTGTTPNCTSEVSFTVTISTAPVVNAVADVTACDTYTLGTISGSGSYYTGPGGTGTPLLTGAQITSTQTIYVYAVAGTCSTEEQFDVTITATPDFVVSGGCQGALYVLEATSPSGVFDPSATFLWAAGVGGQILSGGDQAGATVSGAAEYQLTVTVGGCSQTLAFTATGTSCMIQKGISPNGDGLNDSFDLEGQNVSKLQIFNRYGASVYSRGNYTNQWYGQSDNGDELPDGTYYFVIDRAQGEGRTGWIYINRERN